MLDDLGLVPSIEWLVENSRSARASRATLERGRARPAAVDAQATAIFRIVQESLTNIAKHAQATHADITIARDDGSLVVRVEDDGVGFAMDAPRKPQSFGLFGLARAGNADGRRVSIVSSSPAQGTSIEVRVPRGTGGRADMIRVVIADDHQILREGLAQLLRARG